MNILIVGNGFDLSHYLPTKYDHFMDVMDAIEKKDLGKPIQNVFSNPLNTLPELILKVLEIKRAVDEKTYQMNFDDLFVICRDKKFVSKTKEIYDTTSIILSVEEIVELQYKLKKNCWYQYFKNHVEEIKTWIDFEQKIQDVLTILAECIGELEKIHNPKKIYEYFSEHPKDGSLGIKEKNSKILNFFNFTAEEEYYRQSINLGRPSHKSTRINLNPRFCHGESLLNNFSPSLFLDFLSNQLDDFIEIFNLYLELVVNQLIPVHKFSIESKGIISLDKIYSFNYTNTYQRIYDLVKVEYLHGSHGENQNIVLGIFDLEHDSLRKLKAYGFTKYHQKLFKDTDYLFLDESKNNILAYKKRVEDFEKNYQKPNKEYYRDALRFEEKLNLNFYIWGHSLDVSDKDYIIDLFSLNDDIDRNVRVTVYYFDKNAKFMLLNNLLSILGKDKVEQWMKNKWLQFKENPEIKFNETISEKTA
ncbi:hypothetical protein AY606_10220 [Acinetobacter sp. SFB]|uniref:AbiH family protein n=1 Tax=Acinetobacter sp. SFB TaxID=1805634 RepID=UPI0007D87D90|nr:AbiH family protein [Acinetobacter sp. SFB]OAL77918.1 hypothetical protein AY606_10220 [Acinetobacter sp. SFB]